MEVLTAILKYAASLLAGAYGVYATLTDFREERAGRKVLSRKGYIGIGLLLCSLVLGLSTDAFKDYEDHLKSRRDENNRQQMTNEQQEMSLKLSEQLTQTANISTNLSEALEQLQGTSTKMDSNLNETSTVLKDTQRGLDPIPQPLTLNVTITIPVAQPGVMEYFSRIRPTIARQRKERDTHALIEPGSELFPDVKRVNEASFAKMLRYVRFEVDFTRRPGTLTSIGDLSLVGECGLDSVERPHIANVYLMIDQPFPVLHDHRGNIVPTTQYSAPTFDATEGLDYSLEALQLACNTEMQVFNDDGEFLSLRDFAGAKVSANVKDLNEAESYMPFGEVWLDSFRKTELKYVISGVTISTPTGRSIGISFVERLDCLDGRVCFVGKIPSKEQWSSSLN